MICEKCGIGELMLYKELDVALQFKITKGGRVHKYPVTRSEFDTEKDYLECKNMNCNQYFDYQTGKNGEIIKESVVQR